MRLSRLSIKNYSRISDMELHVRQHLVLVGPNDSGKTSVLRCLNMLLGADLAHLYAEIKPEHLRYPDQPLVIEADLIGFEDQDRQLFAGAIAPDGGEDRLTLRLSATFDESQTLAIDRRAIKRSARGQERIGQQLSEKQLAAVGWTMFDTSSASCTVNNYRTVLGEVLKSVDLGRKQAEFDALADSFRGHISNSAVLENLRNSLVDQLAKTLPGPIARDDLTLIPDPQIGNNILSSIHMQIKKDGVPHNLADYSDGMRSLYAIALYDILSCGANLVCIDEPESHLHPTTQRSLARLLQSRPNQKILATHSADIVGAFPPECIVTVHAGGKVIQPALGFLTRNERISVRWWTRGRLEPLTALRVVAVEGISDRIILEAAADATGRNLDRLGVSVIEANGSGDMGPIYKLFGPKGFSIPLSLLIDLDAVNHTAAQLNIPKGRFSQNSIWVSQRDLEEEYTSAIGAERLWEALNEADLFSNAELRGASKTDGKHTEKDVAAFCRQNSSHKVRAALIAASIIDAPTAMRIKSISALLDEIAPAADDPAHKPFAHGFFDADNPPDAPTQELIF